MDSVCFSNDVCILEEMDVVSASSYGQFDLSCSLCYLTWKYVVSFLQILDHSALLTDTYTLSPCNKKYKNIHKAQTILLKKTHRSQIDPDYSSSLITQ